MTKKVVCAPTYDSLYFDLAPTWTAWCFLRGIDLQALQRHDNLGEHGSVYFYGNHPVIWGRIVGVVVAVDEFATKRVFTVDDSTGACVECLASNAKEREKIAHEKAAAAAAAAAAPAPAGDGATGQDEETTRPAVAFPEVDVGAVVDVKGRVSTFREEKQLRIERMTVVPSTAQEVLLWEKRRAFYEEVLEVPWRLGRREKRQRDEEVRRRFTEARGRS